MRQQGLLLLLKNNWHGSFHGAEVPVSSELMSEDENESMCYSQTSREPEVKLWNAENGCEPQWL